MRLPLPTELPGPGMLAPAAGAIVKCPSRNPSATDSMPPAMDPDLAMQWQQRLHYFAGPVSAFAGFNSDGSVSEHLNPGQLGIPSAAGFGSIEDLIGPQTGSKGELLQPAQQQWGLTAWEQWQPEDFSTSSISSSNASSLSLPMQKTWDDMLTQPQSAAAMPLLWQPQVDVHTEQSMVTSAGWLLPGSAASSMGSPFAAHISSGGMLDQPSTLSAGQQYSNALEATADGVTSGGGQSLEQAAPLPPKQQKATTRTRAEQHSRRRQQQKIAQQRYRERQRVWVIEGEARMSELSAQLQKAQAAKDVLVDRKASLQADIATLEVAVAKAEAEAAALRERLATPRPAVKPHSETQQRFRAWLDRNSPALGNSAGSAHQAAAAVIHNLQRDGPAEAAQQQRIAGALGWTPVQVQTLLWTRKQQLAQLTGLVEDREVLSMQVRSQMLAALQPAFVGPEQRFSGIASAHELPVLTGIVDMYAAIEALQANSAQAQQALTALDNLVVSRVLTPLQRAVPVVESVPAAPDTLALVDVLADMQIGRQLAAPQPITGLAIAA